MPALRPPAGFSLLELLIVVLILGISALVALPLSSGADAARLDRATADVVSAFDFARNEALRTGAPHGVRLSTTEHRLRVFRVDTATTPPGEAYTVRHPVSRQLYDVRLEETAPVRLAAATFSFADASSGSAVAFNARGAPGYASGAGSFVLLSAGQVDVSLGREVRSVTLAPETGRVAAL